MINEFHDSIVNFLKQQKSDKHKSVYPKKLFISLGMSGVDENIVRNKIGYVIEMVSIKYDYPIECIHNYDTVGPKDVGRLWYLGEAIKKLDGCDTIYMCNGWEHHNGCIIEYIIAKLYGLNIIYEN